MYRDSVGTVESYISSCQNDKHEPPECQSGGAKKEPVVAMLGYTTWSRYSSRLTMYMDDDRLCGVERI